MVTECGLLRLTDQVVKDISMRVAQLEMRNVPFAELDIADCRSLVVTTTRDYQLTIVFYAGSCVLRAITERMKRDKATDESEITAYTTEFFNILCGHVISSMNKLTNTSARFGIPVMIEGLYADRSTPPSHAAKVLNYENSFGLVKVQVFYVDGAPISGVSA